MSTPFGVVQFEAPLANPSPQGLYAATMWADETGPLRWLDEGVQVRRWNYGGESAAGVWDSPWCSEPGSGDVGSGDIKTGTRPHNPDPFTSFTVWAYDQCDPTAYSQDEVRLRVQQTMRLQEQVMVERQFAERLLDDAADEGIMGAPDLRVALGYIEGLLAKTNTVGVVHASPEWASREFGLLVPSGAAVRTPLGHLWIFGGGYVDGLGDTIIATSPVYGWRGPVTMTERLEPNEGTFLALAERSVVLGYEQLIGAVLITDSS